MATIDYTYKKELKPILSYSCRCQLLPNTPSIKFFKTSSTNNGRLYNLYLFDVHGINKIYLYGGNSNSQSILYSTPDIDTVIDFPIELYDIWRLENNQGTSYNVSLSGSNLLLSNLNFTAHDRFDLFDQHYLLAYVDSNITDFSVQYYETLAVEQNIIEKEVEVPVEVPVYEVEEVQEVAENITQMQAGSILCLSLICGLVLALVVAYGLKNRRK